jgi:hypothetical protein
MKYHLRVEEDVTAITITGPPTEDYHVTFITIVFATFFNSKIDKWGAACCVVKMQTFQTRTLQSIKFMIFSMDGQGN